MFKQEYALIYYSLLWINFSQTFDFNHILLKTWLSDKIRPEFYKKYQTFKSCNITFGI